MRRKRGEEVGGLGERRKEERSKGAKRKRGRD